MKPPYNRKQQLSSTLLRSAGAKDAGLHVVLYATLGLMEEDDPFTKMPPALAENAAQLLHVPGLPGKAMLVLDAAKVPAGLLPPPAPLELAVALLACSGSRMYDPRRPALPTRSRLIRSIVLLQPRTSHAL
jgi:hypothetical protein